MTYSLVMALHLPVVCLVFKEELEDSAKYGNNTKPPFFFFFDGSSNLIIVITNFLECWSLLLGDTL